jgi:hypothetical protein
MDLIKESPNFFEEGSIGGIYLLLLEPVHSPILLLAIV